MKLEDRANASGVAHFYTGRTEEAIRYAMSLPVAVTITGVDSLDVLRQNLGIARGFRPMLPAEMDALRKRCAPAAPARKYTSRFARW